MPGKLTGREFLQEAWIKLQEKYADRSQRNRPPCKLKANTHWEQKLHDCLHVEWPCAATSEFWDAWGKTIGELEASGVRAGPESFKDYNDGDAGFLRTVWCLIRHLRTERVIETGVAHGLSSRLILEAMKRNGSGHLWSIDLPPMDGTLHERVGIAVGDRFAEEWTYIPGSSRRCLPPLLGELGQIDLFIHDSLHSERNVRFELEQAYAAVRPGGAVVVDDIDVNEAFRHFTETFSGYQSFICEAEPIRPDVRRFNDKGLYGIILKASAAKPATV